VTGVISTLQIRGCKR